MKNVVVPVKNLARLAEASDALLTRTPGTPGMGLIFGQSGLGKTTATAWFVNRCNGVYVRAMASWTSTAMLQSILRELEIEPKGRTSALAMQIVENLRLTARPLFIDEFDYIVEDKRMTETLRDIHDITSVPIVLIGMNGIQRKIQAREQFANRIAQFVEFKGIDYEDCQGLCGSLCEVTVADELLKKLYEASKGVTRLLVVGLSTIERRAKTLGLEKITLNDWGKADLFIKDTKKRGF